MMISPRKSLLLLGVATAFLSQHGSCWAFSPSDSPNFNNKKNTNDNTNDEYVNNAFSLSAYQKAQAWETSQSLDATRLHFQILFVDDDNAKGRIAEGLLAKIAEDNDATCILFPSCATIANAHSAPRDAAAPQGAASICRSLGLDTFRADEIGTAFELSNLDDYDLVIAMDDEIRALILRSLALVEGDDHSNNHDYYSQKCRSFSEFLSMAFCGSIHSYANQDDDNYITGNDKNEKDSSNAKSKDEVEALLNMLDTPLRSRVEPFWGVFHDESRPHRQLSINSEIFRHAEVPTSLEVAESQPAIILSESGAAVPNTREGSWPMVQAAMVLASAGLTRFCLDTIDAQFHHAFQTLLERNLCRLEHLELTWETVDDQLQRCNAAVYGYFSPKQRKAKFERHRASLQTKLAQDAETLE